MKIAFGLDGTLWSYQNTFMKLQDLLQNSGHRVGILTTHTNEVREADLRLLNARGFSAFDFFICRTVKDNPEEEDSASWKLRMMAVHNIDLLFDDCDNGNENMYQELMDCGHVVRIKPRLPLSKHFR